MSWQDNMIKGLNRSLSPPFLPKGFAKARITYNKKREDPELWLTIGDRTTGYDVDGKEAGSGSKVGEAVEWQIEKINHNPNGSCKNLVSQTLELD